LNVSAEIEGITETVHNYVVVNIDFGTITGIKWKDHMEPPTELTGDSGSASFSAEVFGQGKLDQQ
jgi:Na+-transporting NADH:ubiquinone oxidoreductase subunit NqrC